MYDAILIITALVIVLLGIRLAMKFREMARWNDEDKIVSGTARSAIPAELRELKIEEPTDDSLNRFDASEDSGSSGNQRTTGKT